LTILFPPKGNTSVLFFLLSSSSVKDERMLMPHGEKLVNYTKDQAINEAVSQYTVLEFVRYVYSSKYTFTAVSSLRDESTSFRDLRTVPFRPDEKLLPKTTLYTVGQ